MKNNLLIYRIIMRYCTLILLTFSTTLLADQMAIYWTGRVSSVMSFSDGSVPNGVCEGAQIHGTLFYANDQTIGHLRIMGNMFGDKYQFSDGLIQTIRIGTNEWKVVGGDLSLLKGDMLLGNQQVFDIFSTSANSIHEKFPKYAGHYELGWALFDNTGSHTLYESNNIQNLAINWHQICYANGFVSSSPNYSRIMT